MLNNQHEFPIAITIYISITCVFGSSSSTIINPTKKTNSITIKSNEQRFSRLFPHGLGTLAMSDVGHEGLEAGVGRDHLHR
jgi:hypothetical protein